MDEKINLKEIERKAYLSYHQDGLLDIFMGMFILAFGFYILSDSKFPIMAVLPALLVPVWARVKKKITYPRIGYVKFGKGTRTRRTKSMLLMSGVLTLLLGLGIYLTITMRSGPIPHWLLVLGAYGMIVAGGVVAIILSLVAYINGINRLYIYAALFFAAYSTGHFLVIIPGFDAFQRIAVVNIPLGVIILGYGLFILNRFLHDYPIPDGDEFDERE